MSDLASVRVMVFGRVQGVFFRASTARWAEELGLSGYVRNLSDDQSLEVLAEGERNKLEKLVGYLEVGPPRARVERLVSSWSEYTGSYTAFSIKY